MTQWYFLRLADNYDHYVHYEMDAEHPYVVKKGIVSACLFEEDNAKEFIKVSGASNLEMVPAEGPINEHKSKKYN